MRFPRHKSARVTLKSRIDAKAFRLRFYVAVREKGAFTDQSTDRLGKPAFSTESTRSGRSPRSASGQTHPPLKPYSSLAKSGRHPVGVEPGDHLRRQGQNARGIPDGVAKPPAAMQKSASFSRPRDRPIDDCAVEQSGWNQSCFLIAQHQIVK